MCNLTKPREEKKMSGSSHAQQISQSARPTIVAANQGATEPSGMLAA
jgi:hypothetical protein